MVRLDDRLVAAPPARPDRACSRRTRCRTWATRPRASTRPTTADVGGDLSQIDTRAAARRTCTTSTSPTWWARSRSCSLFATPLLCQSRVCGPVVDIAEQVKSERGDDADFIHMEIYKDNEVDEGLPAAGRWHGAFRPSRGCSRSTAAARSRARLEGAFSARELNAAIDKAVKG